MKLKHLKNYFKDIDWNKEALIIDFDPDGNLTASFSHLFNMEDDISISYYWYDHLARMNRPDLIKKIENALSEHNFECFAALAEQIKNEDIMITLPQQAFIWNKTVETCLGYIYLNADTFNLITDHEYECG